MTALETHFLTPLAEFYGREKFGPGFARKLAPYAEPLDADALKAVADKLAEEYQTFPSFKACSVALTNAAQSVAHTSTAPRPWDTKARDAAEWKARKAACAICRCPLGEEADREGWLVALIDFCTDNGRLPQGREIIDCKAKARRSEDALEACRGSYLYPHLVKLRRNMLERASLDVFGSSDASERFYNANPRP